MLSLELHELKLLSVTVRDYQLALLRMANRQVQQDEARKDAAVLNAIGEKIEAELEARA